MLYFSKLLICLVACISLNDGAVISTLSEVDEDKNVNITWDCKVLTECKFYTDLIKLQKTRSINLQQESISAELKKQNCGWENDAEPKVKCPSDKLELTTRNGFVNADETCTGSLNLKHSSLESLGEYRQVILSEKNEYINIRKKFPVLKKNIIHGLQANGDCCWELFSLPRYRGKKLQTVWPGEIYLPEFQAVSAKGKICDR